MAEPFKNFLNQNTVRDIGSALRAAWPQFARKGFEAQALAGLDTLELKARAMHLCGALETTLPADFTEAADVLQRAIDAGLAGWALWPVGEYVARRGQQTPDSDYVRRSVANHLNDIAKDHPGLVADWLERHLPSASAQRRALLRHASRSLIKQGDARVLAAWGLGARLRGEAQLSVKPRRIKLGGSIVLEVGLQSSLKKPQALVVDYAIHHVKANGSSSPKVFKGWTLRLGSHEQRTLRKTHAIKPITTRRYFSGSHRVELLVNGQAIAEAGFELKA